jgi:hypothetical protein
MQETLTKSLTRKPAGQHNAPKNKSKLLSPVTGITSGSTTVTASLGGVSGTTTLTITAKTVTKLVVSPSSASIVKGAAEQFAATAT